MEGQLSWDGVVYPLTSLTWEGVLETANRFEGLDLDETFSVCYKDEEGEAITVKSEIDMKEAVDWAKEQRIPLCLTIPRASSYESDENHDDSDEEWVPISATENNSPRLDSSATTRNFQVSSWEKKQEESDERDSSFKTPTKIEEKDSYADTVSNEEEEEEVEDAPTTQFVQFIVAENPETEPERVVERRAPEVSGDDDEEVEEQQEREVVVAKDEDRSEEETRRDRSDVENQRLSAIALPNLIQAENPIIENLDDEEEEEEEVALSTTNSDSTLDKLVNTLLSANGAGTIEFENDAVRETLLRVFSNKSCLREAGLFLQKEEVQNAIATVAQFERVAPGSALKSATTQAIKLSRVLLDAIERSPQLESLIPHVLRSLPGSLHLRKSSETIRIDESARSIHVGVLCDGCEECEELVAASISAGNRSRGAHGEIVGIRYKSAVVPDYDLCESCEKTGRFQVARGPFLKIVDPSTAPEMILCVMPGATSGMMSQIGNMDWRNPLANEFLEFVQTRQQRAFSRPTETNRSSEESEAQSTPHQQHQQEKKTDEAILVAPGEKEIKPESKCKHALKTFETSHGHFTCDVCMTKQPTRSIMHGCRPCNYDVCQACHSRLGLPLQVPQAPAPPQAKFVSDVTLADGSVVRPGEHLNKTWRVRNSGAETWPAGTRIAHVGGDSFGGPLNGVEVPHASPGEAVNVSVPLVMPNQPGRYTSYWRLMTPHPQNCKFGHRFWVTVNVVASVPPPPVAVRVSHPPPIASMRPIPSAPQIPQIVVGSPTSRPRPPPPVPPVVAVANDVVEPAFEMAVAQITEFGFSDVDKIVKILREVNGDTGAAIDRLLEEGTD
jgi:hypothetical protein